MRAADGKDRQPCERAPQRPQIRRGCGGALQRLADQRIGVHLRHALRVGAVTQACDLIPARIAQARPGGCVVGAQLRDRLGPAAHGSGLAGVAADALEPRGVDFRADVVEHDARDELRVHRRQHHRHESAHGGADDAHAGRTQTREQPQEVLKIDRDLVVVVIRIARREAAAAHVGHDEAVARRQACRQLEEIAAVAHQPVQAQHHR